MIFKHLLESVDSKKIEETLIGLYPNEKENIKNHLYQNMFEKMKELSLLPNDDNMTLHVELTEDCGTTTLIWSSTFSVYRRYQKKFYLEFTSLERIISAYVKEEEVTNKEEYVARVLWELLYAFTSDKEEIDTSIEAVETRNPASNSIPSTKESVDYCSREDILKLMDDEQE